MEWHSSPSKPPFVTCHIMFFPQDNSLSPFIWCSFSSVKLPSPLPAEWWVGDVYLHAMIKRKMPYRVFLFPLSQLRTQTSLETDKWAFWGCSITEDYWMLPSSSARATAEECQPAPDAPVIHSSVLIPTRAEWLVRDTTITCPASPLQASFSIARGSFQNATSLLCSKLLQNFFKWKLTI